MPGTRLPLTLALVAYKKADVVELALASAAHGSQPPDLVVISDDGSDDGTPDVAEDAARSLGLPCVVVRHRRVGRYRLQTMRNTCIANALDGVVLISDSDCIFGPRTLETIYELHLQNPSAVGTGPRYEFLSGNSGPFTSTFATLEFSHFPHATYGVPVGANLSFRKSLWRRLGGFDRSFEGLYGIDEFEFTARAELAGARCISDPGAYLFHIPHDTVFGGRSPHENIRKFDTMFGRTHVADEWFYIARRVVPWYWRGHRRRPLLDDRIELDAEWGAPPGFVPPLHLQLSRSLQPLIGPAQRLLAAPSEEHLAALRMIPLSIYSHMVPQTSPAQIYLQDLHWITQTFPIGDELARRLRHWLEGARGVDAVMQCRQREGVLT